MRNSRLIGGKPKIGIRPIIDGRRGGIRESLQIQLLVEWLKLPWRLKNSVIVESVLYFL